MMEKQHGIIERVGSLRAVRLLKITVRTFLDNFMGFQCVALSYFITLAIIPLFAFIFAVSGGLGLSDSIYTFLCSIFPGNVDIIDIIMSKADNIINAAKSGWVGLISALAFSWTIFWMMFQVERVFNNVWGIKKVPRKFYKRFSFYVLLLCLMPLLLAVFVYGFAFFTDISTLIGLDMEELGPLRRILVWLSVYGMTALTLSVMYKFIPAAEVRFSCAFKSALVSSAVFLGFQFLYLRTQLFVSHVNGVYGAIAAVPLFLIWLNISWQIIIYGAELNYGMQHLDQ